MTPVDLPPIEPSSIRPGGQWQPPATEARVAVPIPASDAWSITGAGWPIRPEEVFGLLLTWPETRSIPTPQAVADLRQLFESSALDASDTEAVAQKLQAVFRGSVPDLITSDWTANLANLLGSQLTQLTQQAGTRTDSPPDGLTQLIRHALTVLNRESTPLPATSRDVSPPAPLLPPAVRILQTAGEQSYFISERETASGLLTQQPTEQVALPGNTPRSMPEVPAAPTPQQPGAGQSANARGAAGADTPDNTPANLPAGTPAGARSQTIPSQPQGGMAQTSVQDLSTQTQTRSPPAAQGFSTPTAPAPAPASAAAPASVVAPAPSAMLASPSAPASMPQTRGDAISTPATPAQPVQPGVSPLVTPGSTAPVVVPGALTAPLAPASVPASFGAVPAPVMFASGTETVPAGTGNAQAAALPQAQGDVPMPSLAEILARVSSFQQQASPAPTLRWPFMASASDEALPSAASERPGVQGEAAPSTSSAPQPDAPAVAAHLPAGRGGPAVPGRFVPSGRASVADASSQALVKGEARTEVAGVSTPLSARVDEAAQSVALPQQRVGMIPLMVGQEAMPAWLQMEWKPVDDREGRGGQAKDQQALMVSVHIAGETIGRVAFHLAWLPKELAGTIVMDKPEVLRAAQEELPGLETRLAEAGLPPPRLRLLRHTAAPWQEETQEIDRT